MYYNDFLEDVSGKIIEKTEKRTKMWKIGFIIIAIMFLVFGISNVFMIRFLQSKLSMSEEKCHELQREMDVKSFEMTIEGFALEAMINPTRLDITSLYEAAIVCGAQFPEVIVAQAQIESGMGRSNLGKNHNNLFGMMWTPNDKFQCGKYNKWAEYLCWQHALCARVEWDIRNGVKECETVDEYIDELYRKGYFLDPGYKEKLKKQIFSNNL